MLRDQSMTGYPSVDQPWLKNYYSGEAVTAQTSEFTIYQNVFDHNKDNSKDIAIRYMGNHISYQKLFDNVEECAKTFKYLGVKSGDFITICSMGVPEAIFAVLACSRVGAIANLINPLFTKQQMIARINETASKFLLVLDELYDRVDEVIKETCIEHVVIIPATNSCPDLMAKTLFLQSKARKIVRADHQDGRVYLLWKDFLLQGKTFNGKIDVPYVKDTPVVMVYSSGTTGASKGILLTNDGINFTVAYYSKEYFTYDRGDTFLQILPMFLSTGIVLTVLMPLCKGLTIICEPQFTKENFAKQLLKYKPTFTLATPSFWIYIMNANKDEAIDLSWLRYPISGGEKTLPRDDDILNEWLIERGSQKIIKGYGMCELGSTVTTTTPINGDKFKKGGCGYPIPQVIVAAFDKDTNKEKTYGERGEIRVCSPAHMKGYYKNPKATQEFFWTDSEGRVWGCTGDIGYVDEDGEVFVLGRSTDSYQMPDGTDVYMFDIEDAILQNENVSACKVVDIEENEAVVLSAHIVLNKDCHISEKEFLTKIHKEIKQKLETYQLPKYYKIWDALPVHPNGKRDIEKMKADRDGLVNV